MDSHCPWYCLSTRAKCENVTSAKLAEKQIEVLNPRLPARRGSGERMIPLFPGYIFARFALATDYYRVVWTPGLKAIIGNGSEPVSVEPELIQLIVERVEAACRTGTELKPGDRVRIESGPFRSLDGVFSSYCSGKQRVKVLLELFNQPVLVALDLKRIA
ncbi:MAG: hypothetical protein HYS05_05360 [Acidobacteria bacterium]|nr:hypothetical protein [Acidobacteriota bacterium]